jgi:hypothetical protein
VVRDYKVATLTLRLIEHLLRNINSQEYTMHLVVEAAYDKTRVVVTLLQR